MLAFIDGPQMIVVGLVMLLLFGNRLPSVMRSLGQGMVEFKKGMAGIEDDHDTVPKRVDKIERGPDKIEE